MEKLRVLGPRGVVGRRSTVNAFVQLAVITSPPRNDPQRWKFVLSESPVVRGLLCFWTSFKPPRDKEQLLVRFRPAQLPVHEQELRCFFSNLAAFV